MTAPATPEPAPSSAFDVLRDDWRRTSWWELLRDGYLSFDRRTLGFTRLMLGFYLIMDLCRRSHAWWQMFSDEGVLPNHLNLFRPQGWGNFSIVNAFSTRGETWVFFFVVLATYLCLFVGYKTKIAQVLALIFVTGMNGRVLLIENGGYVVQNLLLLWTVFLPLGDRFSVDALLRSMKLRRERSAAELNDRTDRVEPRLLTPHVTVLGLVLLIQLAAIYFFNIVHKTGPAWHNGTAVHYVLYVDRMVTPLVAMARDYIPNFAIIFMTWSAVLGEGSLPFFLLLPLFRVWMKRAAIVVINMLHIAFGTTFVLGPFAWALCVFSTLLFSREDWELAIRTMRRTHRARTIAFSPRSSAQLALCRLLKRVDTFELLTFEEHAADNLAVIRPSGQRVRGAEAVIDVLCVIPVFPAIAWTLRLPPLRQLTDAAVRYFETHRTSTRFHFGAPTPTVAFEPSPLGRVRRGAVVTLRELATLVMFAGALNQAAVELWVLKPYKFKQPEATRVLAHKMRFLQGWFMFAPNPVMDDGTIVVDAITVDGRHVDPFWNEAPNFDLIHAKSFGYNQIWSDYFNRMHLPGNSGYRDAMRDYLLRLPERTGDPNDAIVSGDVYWVKDMNPRWDQTESYNEERVKLFSFTNPKHGPDHSS